MKLWKSFWLNLNGDSYELGTSKYGIGETHVLWAARYLGIIEKDDFSSDNYENDKVMELMFSRDWARVVVDTHEHIIFVANSNNGSAVNLSRQQKSWLKYLSELYGYDVFDDQVVATKNKKRISLESKQYDKEDLVYAFAQHIRDRHQGVQFDLGYDQRDGTVSLEWIRIKKEEQGKGLGTKVMEELCDWADDHKFLVYLAVADRSKEYGTTSKGRLEKFYRRFGFKINSGRNKRFELSMYAHMYRDPR